MLLFIIGSEIYPLATALKRKNNRSYTRGVLPHFTVIIPAFNEKSVVLRAVKSVLNNDYPLGKFKVVVVDDGSTDGTGQKVKLFKKKNKIINLFIHVQKNSGKANAMNAAIKKYASGKLIMCLDADSYIAKNALRKAAIYFRDPKVMAVAANNKIIPDNTVLNLVQRFEYVIAYQMKRAQTI